MAFLALSFLRTHVDVIKIIEDENLKADETHKFIDNAFYNGTLKTTGTDIDKLMPRMSRFGGGQRDIKKKILSKN